LHPNILKGNENSAVRKPSFLAYVSGSEKASFRSARSSFRRSDCQSFQGLARQSIAVRKVSSKGTSGVPHFAIFSLKTSVFCSWRWIPCS